jgi:ribonuclease BN (tRNA processing enzyme)
LLHISNLHLPGGKIAKTAGVKHLVLTHYDGENTDSEMIKDAKKSGFSGEISIGKDFQTFKL